MPSELPRLDYRVIMELVKDNSSVLDLGCGDGELLSLLVRERRVRGQGIELDDQAIYQCVAKGLSVFHGDLDSGLSDYADASFDYVIINQTLQQVRKPDVVLAEALRVGRQVIVGFPNFAHYSARWQLAIAGKAPITAALPYQWHDTPNLHFLSISDFNHYCRERRIRVESRTHLAGERRIRLLPNLRAQSALFVLSRS